MLRFFQLLLFSFISIANCDNFSSTLANTTDRNKDVFGVQNMIGQIPCHIDSLQDVAMILWFKDSSGTPIYSYDSRNEKEEPRHLTLKNDSLGLRLYFRVYKKTDRRSPTLMIRDLTLEDRGLYRTDIKINCSAFGAKPPAQVQWFQNGEIVDSTYTLVSNNYTTNELTITNLSGNHNHDIFSCKAGNNNQTRALSHRVNIDVYVGVKKIELEFPGDQIAGIEYIIKCKAYGSYPTVKLEFFKLGKRLGPKFQMKSNMDETTVFSMPFKPEMEDDEEILTCRAENPWLNEKPIQTRKRLRIKYSPITILKLGTNRTQFSEFDSLLLVCHTKANPPPHIIRWFDGQDKQLFDNEATGVQINGRTLFLKQLSQFPPKFQPFCEAENTVGKGISNQLIIDINVLPRCASRSISSYPAQATQQSNSNSNNNFQVPLGLGESHNLSCIILAWPPDLNFYWTLNRSLDISPTRYTSSSSTSNPTFSPKFSKNPLPLSTTSSLPTTSTFQPSTILQSDQDLSSNSVSESEYSTSTTTDGTQEPFKPSTSILFSGSDENIANYSQTNREDSRENDNDTFEVQVNGTESTDTDNTTSILNYDVNRSKRSIRRKEIGLNQNSLRHENTIEYKVSSESDYGIIQCWAQNSFGKQIIPCNFHIVPKGVEPADSKITVDNIYENQDQAHDQLLYDTSIDDLVQLETSYQGESEDSTSSKLDGEFLQIWILFIGLPIFIGILLFSGCFYYFLSCRKTRRRKSEQVATVKVISTISNPVNIETISPDFC